MVRLDNQDTIEGKGAVAKLISFSSSSFSYVENKNADSEESAKMI
ncbi:MAG: hypothetical protein ACTHKA_23315 [Anaerocolumna jejuensis]